VAAAFAGGVVRYRKYDAAPLLSAATKGGLLVAMEQSPSVDLARMGEPVFPMLFAFSGRSASTTSLVKEVERKFDDPARRRFVERSDALGEALETGLLRRDFGAVESASEGLQALLGESR